MDLLHIILKCYNAPCNKAYNRKLSHQGIKNQMGWDMDINQEKNSSKLIWMLSKLDYVSAKFFKKGKMLSYYILKFTKT